MQSSIFLSLSQARINWEGCNRKGIRHKNDSSRRWIGDWSGWSESPEEAFFWDRLTWVVPEKQP